MSVAVVVAFFICWAPFHAQRLMTVYILEGQWTPTWLELQSHLFYISGHSKRVNNIDRHHMLLISSFIDFIHA